MKFVCGKNQQGCQLTKRQIKWFFFVRATLSKHMAKDIPVFQLVLVKNIRDLFESISENAKLKNHIN